MNRLMPILSGLAAIVVLSGCAAGGRHGGGAGHVTLMPATVCPPQACDVQVKVWTDAQGVCKAAVSDETIQVRRGNSPVLTWELRPLDPFDGHEYRFNAATGIEFKPSSPITPLDFTNNHAVGHDKYRWKAVNGRPPPPRTFHYNVNLQRKPVGGAWADCPVLDPRIVNDGL